MIPNGFVQDLLARCDVVEVVGRHVELKKAGINYKGLCPFHGEKSPSFIVSPSRQTYHCFGCGVHGDAIRFLTEHLGLSFVEAVEDLAQASGMVVPQDDRSAAERAQAAQAKAQQSSLTELLEKAARHYRQQLKGNDRAVAYLKGRGLSGQVAATFGLGYAPEGWRSLASAFARYDDPQLAEAGLVIVQGEDGEDQKRYDRFRDRIMFPIRNVKGDTIGFGGRVLDRGEPKYLNSPETPVFSKGRELYGLYEARTGLREKGYALVTEGYMDVVALAQLGFPNAVATLGTACTADHVHKLLRFTEQVVFSFDGDAAGRRAAGRALEAALPHASDTRSFRFLFLPAEHDPDSFIRERGAAAFEAQVQGAVPLSRQLLEHAAQDCDLGSAEGRARMLAQARPLWQALPEGALKLQLLGDLARQGGLPSEELSRLWRPSGGQPRDAHRPESVGEAPPNGIDDAPPRADRRWPSDGWTGPRRRADGSGTWRDRRGAPDWGGPRVSGARPRPKGPEDRVVQMLFGQPAWWLQLSPHEHELLHGLPGAHGRAIAWLERDLEEHGPRSWAVIKEVLAAANGEPTDAPGAPAGLDDTADGAGAGLDPQARGLADGDADPDATLDDFRMAVDLLLEHDIGRQAEALLPLALQDPAARAQYDELQRLRSEIKRRLRATPRTD